MAIEVLRKEQAAIAHAAPNVPSVIDEESRVKWGGIFCGSFITIGLGFLFMVLGGTIGLPSIIALNPMVPEFITGSSPSEGPFILIWLYTLLTLAGSFFIGGFCASRIARIRKPGLGGLYGLSSWAVVVTALIWITTSVSPYVEQLLAGTLPASSSWLVFSILVLGAFASTLGGSTGRALRVGKPSITENEGRLKTAS